MGRGKRSRQEIKGIGGISKKLWGRRKLRSKTKINRPSPSDRLGRDRNTVKRQWKGGVLGRDGFTGGGKEGEIPSTSLSFSSSFCVHPCIIIKKIYFNNNLLVLMVEHLSPCHPSSLPFFFSSFSVFHLSHGLLVPFWLLYCVIRGFLYHLSFIPLHLVSFSFPFYMSVVLAPGADLFFATP